MILGNKSSKGPSDMHNPSLFLNVAKDRKIYLSQGAGKSGFSFSKQFSSTSDFSFAKENKLSLELNRVSAGKLTLKVFLNDKQIKLVGDKKTASGGIEFLTDEDGTFASNVYLSSTGTGQRLGIYPSTNSKVTISGLKVTPVPSQK